MTGQDLIILAISLFGETKDSVSEYTSNAVSYINILLSEAFNVNNSIRKSKKLDVLSSAPVIASIADSITYENELLYQCLPYGLAAKYILEDNDYAKYNAFTQMYTQALNSCQKAEQTPIVDVYSEDSE